MNQHANCSADRCAHESKGTIVPVIRGEMQTDIHLCDRHLSEYIERHCDPVIARDIDARNSRLVLSYLVADHASSSFVVVLSEPATGSRIAIPVDYFQLYSLRMLVDRTRCQQSPFHLLYNVITSLDTQVAHIYMSFSNRYSLYYASVLEIRASTGDIRLSVTPTEAVALSVLSEMPITIVERQDLR